jgi:hypothetical protein
VVSNRALGLPDRFGASQWSYPAVAATSSHLVGFGASDDGDEPEAVSPVFEGELVDLATGEVRVVDAPTRDGAPVWVLGVAADDDRVVALGRTCADVEEGTVDCAPGTLAAFDLDPASGRWTDVDLPDEMHSFRLRVVSFMAATGEDEFVAIVQEAGSAESFVLTSTSDGWRLVATLEGRRTLGRCVADGSIFSLSASGGVTEENQSEDPAMFATLALVRVDLAGGMAQELELPAASGAYGGAGAHLGCTPAGPVLASSEPDTEYTKFQPATAWAMGEDGSWSVLEGVVPSEGVFIVEAISGPRGVLLAGLSPLGENRTTSLASIDRSLTVDALDPSEGFFGAQPVWRGLSGTVLWLSTGEPTSSLIEQEVWR